MKTSVLIIAHNEEKYIDKCINSIMRQTMKPEEVVLVAHNSTDSTKEIAEKYAINIVSFNGPKGIVYARIEGLKHVTGDIILCIDGDSEAQANWVRVMRETLEEDSNVLVGSWVKFRGTFYGWINNLYNKTRCVKETESVARWIWGPSFGFWGHDKDYVRDIFEQSIYLSKELGLSRNPDDFWLALFMNRRGHLQVTNETFVTLNTKEHSNRSALERNLENIRNGNIMEEYFRANF